MIRAVLDKVNNCRVAAATPSTNRGSGASVAAPHGEVRRFDPAATGGEGVGDSLAKRELANGGPHDVEELMKDVIRSIERIRKSPVRLRSCIKQSELPPFFALTNAFFMQIPISKAFRDLNAVTMRLKTGKCLKTNKGVAVRASNAARH
jgi:hypothetical protein